MTHLVPRQSFSDIGDRDLRAREGTAGSHVRRSIARTNMSDLGNKEAEFKQKNYSSAAYVIGVICILTGSSCVPLGLQGNGQNLVPCIVFAALWAFGGGFFMYRNYMRAQKKTVIELFSRGLRRTEHGKTTEFAFADVVQFQQRVFVIVRNGAESSRSYEARLAFKDGTKLEVSGVDLEGVPEGLGATLERAVPVQPSPWNASGA